MRKKPLSEQVVVVADGSYGLGRAITAAAARRGAMVVVGARGRDALDGAVRNVEAAGSRALTLETDVAAEQFGRIDTWIANVMVTVYAEAHRLEDDELRLHRGTLGAAATLGTIGLLAGRQGRFPTR